MINIYIVLIILFIHWIADFVCQTDKQAKGKSTNFNILLQHTFIYSIIWFIPSLFVADYITDNAKILLFVPITFVTHTAIDFFTSKVNSSLWANGEIHEFFVSIGFDQFLHFTQLLFTYYILTK